MTGADDLETALELQRQLYELFIRGGFVLRKWNSSNEQILKQIPSELLENSDVHAISDINA
jgi:hypothetical protein